MTVRRNHHDHYLHHQNGQRKGHPTHHDQWSSCWTKMSSYTWFVLTWDGIFHSSIPLHMNIVQFLATSRRIQGQVVPRDTLWEICLASTSAKFHYFDQISQFQLISQFQPNFTISQKLKRTYFLGRSVRMSLGCVINILDWTGLDWR